MSSSGHPRITSHRAGKPERLLRASVTAFSTMARPARREIAQLDDLAVPLLGLVSDDCLRYVAAALSDSPFAPPVLVRRLADQPVDICAPLLMRSPVLTDIDLVALIGRHGGPHARAIAARADIDERVMRLIRSIGALEEAGLPPPPDSDKLEEARQRLRAMMRPAAESPPARPVRLRWEGDPGAYRKLRSTALAGVPALFHTALADALAVGIAQARAIADAHDPSDLAVALRSLSLSEEEAFLLIQCASPARPLHPRAVARFLDDYGAITPQEAQRIVAGWRGEHAAGAKTDSPPFDTPANQPSPSGTLRAS